MLSGPWIGLRADGASACLALSWEVSLYSSLCLTPLQCAQQTTLSLLLSNSLTQKSVVVMEAVCGSPDGLLGT